MSGVCVQNTKKHFGMTSQIRPEWILQIDLLFDSWYSLGTFLRRYFKVFFGLLCTNTWHTIAWYNARKFFRNVLKSKNILQKCPITKNVLKKCPKILLNILKKCPKIQEWLIDQSTVESLLQVPRNHIKWSFSDSKCFPPISNSSQEKCAATVKLKTALNSFYFKIWFGSFVFISV